MHKIHRPSHLASPFFLPSMPWSFPEKLSPKPSDWCDYASPNACRHNFPSYLSQMMNISPSLLCMAPLQFSFQVLLPILQQGKRDLLVIFGCQLKKTRSCSQGLLGIPEEWRQRSVCIHNEQQIWQKAGWTASWHAGAGSLRPSADLL